MLPDLKQELEQIALAGRERHFHEVLGRRDGCVTVRGRTAIDFGSWDLYDLNHHPGMKRGAQRAIEEYGLSAVSARASGGTTKLHLACERRIAEFTGFEAAALFSSKNQAVFSLVTALASERDVVLFDELIQSPVGDAAYLVNAPTVPFRSGNLNRVKSELEKSRGARRRFIFVEALSPVTGEAVDLGAWSAAAQKADAWLIVDESCAIGVLGLRGAGGAESLPLKTGLACVYADASMALVSAGAFVAGSTPIARYLTQRSRTFLSEIPLSPAGAATLEGAISTVELAHHQRERLSVNGAKLREGLTLLGAVKGGGAGPIVSISMKSLRLAREVSEALFQKGVYVEALPRPTAASSPSPDGAAYIRFIVSSIHTPKQIDDTLQACSEIWPKLEA